MNSTRQGTIREPFHFVKAFESGIQATHLRAGKASIRCHTVGELVVTSGKLVACDPLVFEDVAPFAQEVAPGRYPVTLALVRYERDSDPYERVASAMVRFSEQEAVRWGWAVNVAFHVVDGTLDYDVENEEASWVIQVDPSVCYDVETGTGCFMDKDAADRLLEWREWNTQAYQAFLQKEGDSPFWEASLDASTGLNVIAFQSGWGDGSYRSCWGYDAQDALVYLATDFGVLSGATFHEG